MERNNDLKLKCKRNYKQNRSEQNSKRLKENEKNISGRN